MGIRDQRRIRWLLNIIIRGDFTNYQVTHLDLYCMVGLCPRFSGTEGTSDVGGIVTLEDIADPTAELQIRRDGTFLAQNTSES
jgi:hypothetical protein